ncbi:MAG: response regulator [Methanococcaceae archaeon]
MTANEKIEIDVVTNSDFLNDNFRRSLTNSICDVQCFSDGLHCIKNAVEKNSSLIFLDMSLVGFHSLDTLKVLHSLKISSMVPIVIMVLNTQNSIVAESIDLGISTVLYKPFGKDDLLKIVNDLIGDKIKEKTEKLSAMEAIKVHTELKKKNISAIEEKMTNMKLLKNFHQILKLRKQEIISSLENKGHKELHQIFNEISPVAAKTGNPRLSLLCDFMEKKLNCQPDDIDWNDVTRYTHEVITLIDQIQNATFNLPPVFVP